jgi:hypothetical protein
VRPEDVLCDFCHVAAWANELPCIEGHHGSIICGDCLHVAYLALPEGSDPSTEACTMCLEVRDDPIWVAEQTKAHICRRCVKQAAGALHKSKDWDWSKPERP